MRADRKLWLTADRTEVVEDGDSRAAFLFVTPGKDISDADAERYGIVSGDGTGEALPPFDGDAESPEEKAEEKTADKSAAAPANKARRTRKRA